MDGKSGWKGIPGLKILQRGKTIDSVVPLRGWIGRTQAQRKKRGRRLSEPVWGGHSCQFEEGVEDWNWLLREIGGHPQQRSRGRVPGWCFRPSIDLYLQPARNTTVRASQGFYRTQSLSSMMQP